MALSSDKFSLLFYEISKEFRLFEDILLTCGLFYAVKTSVSLCFSAYNGFREHIWAKIHRVDLPNTVGKWAGNFSDITICVIYVPCFVMYKC